MSKGYYVLYHGNCMDGFGAAWAAWKALGDAATYIPVFYGKPPPELPENAIVSIVDFSYPRDVLLKLREHCAVVEVLDHHRSAEAELEDLDFCVFDMNKSGAVLAWEWFHPHAKIPLLLEYVQDRDLWRFALPQSHAVTAFLRSFPYTFDMWEYLAQLLEKDLESVVQEGLAILRFQDQQVEMICKQAVTGSVAGYQVPIVNATAFFSEACDRLCELHPEAPFAAYYLDRADGMRQWGLRARGDFDVSEIAERFGGGGHRAAAGFQTLVPEVEPFPI